MRIPRRFLSDAQRRDVHRRRAVWGTEVYTDDSDVLGVLIHLGKLPGMLPDGVDPAMVNDTGRRVNIIGQLSASPTPKDQDHAKPPPSKANGNGNINTASSSPRKPPSNGTPVTAAPGSPATAATSSSAFSAPPIPRDKDLIVNLLILPTLQRYASTTRNAFKSRSWNTTHDGVSYVVCDLEWVDAGEAEGRGISGRKRRLDEREWVRRWGTLPPELGGMGDDGWARRRWRKGEEKAAVEAGIQTEKDMNNKTENKGGREKETEGREKAEDVKDKEDTRQEEETKRGDEEVKEDEEMKDALPATEVAQAPTTGTEVPVGA